MIETNGHLEISNTYGNKESEQARKMLIEAEIRNYFTSGIYKDFNFFILEETFENMNNSEDVIKETKNRIIWVCLKLLEISSAKEVSRAEIGRILMDHEFRLTIEQVSLIVRIVNRVYKQFYAQSPTFLGPWNNLKEVA